MSLTFDTLSYAKKLTDAGERPEVAEVHALALKELISNELATKWDLKEFEASFKRDVEEVHREIKELEIQLQRGMATLKYDLTLRIGSLLVVIGSILGALITIL